MLAEIDAPEVDQQLQQARADLATAEANLRLAEITATRYKDLMKTDSVAQQDVDNATGNYDARRTTVESARSNVKRLEEMQSFEKIYAPFDGVITARNTDIGALIDSGSSGGTARELFHIAAVNRLRVYVNVPQIYSPHIQPGLRADLVLTEFPGRKFEGTVVRDSGAIDNTTRTLLTEIDVNNPTGELKPGGYVEVHLELPSSVTTFTLPGQRDHLQIRGHASGHGERWQDHRPDSDHARPRFRHRNGSPCRASKAMNPWSSILPTRWPTVRQSGVAQTQPAAQGGQ